MNVKRCCTVLIFLLLGVFVASSQENRTEVCFDFRVNNMAVDSLYGDNAARMREMEDFLRNIRNDSLISVVEVAFRGFASPEGSDELNRRLARGRLSALESIVRQELYLPDSVITRDESYISWESLRSQIQDSEIRYKQEILSILDENPELIEYRSGAHIDSRVLKLQRLDNGKVWSQINDLFFRSMRNACAVFVTYKKTVPLVREPETVPDKIVVEPEPVVETVTYIPEEWRRHLYLKTNVVGWGFGISNIAAEIDLARHWSFALPVYYSAWDYFKYNLKFRTLSFQPELRYWFSENNDGWFVGTHFGLGWYNFATGGEYRTQDHDRSSPALGGGLAAGYRLPISRNGRWKMEFSLGAGVYSLHFDKFRNEPNGLLVRTEKKTCISVDQANVSFVYTFDLSRKGGGR